MKRSLLRMIRSSVRQKLHLDTRNSIRFKVVIETANLLDRSGINTIGMSAISGRKTDNFLSYYRYKKDIEIRITRSGH